MYSAMLCICSSILDACLQLVKDEQPSTRNTSATLIAQLSAHLNNTEVMSHFIIRSVSSYAELLCDVTTYHKAIGQYLKDVSSLTSLE